MLPSSPFLPCNLATYLLHYATDLVNSTSKLANCNSSLNSQNAEAVVYTHPLVTNVSSNMYTLR